MQTPRVAAGATGVGPQVTRRRLLTAGAVLLGVAGAVEATGHLGGGALAGTPVRGPMVPGPATGSKPGADNTGVRPGTGLALHEGDLVVTIDGAVIEGFDIHGVVDIRASDVTVRNV